MKALHHIVARAMRRRGYSVVEVAIAVVVLGTALIPCSRLILIAKQASDSDESGIRALNELDRKISVIRQKSFDLIDAEGRAVIDAIASPDCEAEVTVQTLPQNLKKVTVTVYHIGANGNVVEESAEFLAVDCNFPVEKVW
jgi:hypothetical protein